MTLPYKYCTKHDTYNLAYISCKAFKGRPMPVVWVEMGPLSFSTLAVVSSILDYTVVNQWWGSKIGFTTGDLGESYYFPWGEEGHIKKILFRLANKVVEADVLMVESLREDYLPILGQDFREEFSFTFVENPVFLKTKGLPKEKRLFLSRTTYNVSNKCPYP